VRRGSAFGIDGCRVLRATVAADQAHLLVETLPRIRRPLIVKASGPSEARYALRVNGQDRGTFDRAELERGIPMEVT
jgi:hypothetical protein